jgi:hypothetical protein
VRLIETPQRANTKRSTATHHGDPPRSQLGWVIGLEEPRATSMQKHT